MAEEIKEPPVTSGGAQDLLALLKRAVTVDKLNMLAKESEIKTSKQIFSQRQGRACFIHKLS